MCSLDIREAAKAYATVGEVVGVIRMACGYDYDPLGQIRTPAFIKELISE